MSDPRARFLSRPVQKIGLVSLALVLCSGLAAPPPAHAASRVYLRGSVGWDESRDTTVSDLDCASTTPPALFGCGAGIDGKPLGARGDFGDTVAVELAAGFDLGSRTRVELALQSRPGLTLGANANFLGVSDDQPVSADADSLAAFVIGAVDLGRPDWRLQPFVAAGLGAARNEIDRVRYEFPSLGPEAATIVRGGSHTDFAWTAAAGLAYRLNDAATLELAVRYADLGEVRTDAGTATVVRSADTFELEIAGTRADLRTTGVTLGLRYRF